MQHIFLGGTLMEHYMRMKELDPSQDESFIKEMILRVLKEQKVSLSQARVIFYNILCEIEDNNIINL